MIKIQWYIFALIGALATGISFVIEKRTLKSEHPLETMTNISIISFSVALIFLFLSVYNLDLECDA